MNASRLTALDGLRGVAALMVAGGHASTLLGFGYLPAMYAVDLFFMISGFVVPYAYEAKLSAGMSFGRFMEVRLIRLYPLYIAGVMISLIPFLIWAAQDGPWRLKEPLASLPWALLLMPAPHWEAQHSFLLNPPAWSLCLELVINAAYAAFLPWLTTRRVLLIAVLSGLALLAGVRHYGTGDFGTGGVEMVWALARVCCPFAIGVGLYRLWSAGWLTTKGDSAAWLPPILFVLVSLFPGGPIWSLVSFAAIVAIFPVVVILAVKAKPTGLSAVVLRGLGELSYPLYILHMPILVFAGRLAPIAGLTSNQGIAIAMPFAVLLATAAIFVDRRVRVKLTALFHLLRRDIESAPAL